MMCFLPVRHLPPGWNQPFLLPLLPAIILFIILNIVIVVTALTDLGSSGGSMVSLSGSPAYIFDNRVSSRHLLNLLCLDFTLICLPVCLFVVISISLDYSHP